MYIYIKLIIKVSQLLYKRANLGFMVYSVQNSKLFLGKQIGKEKVTASKVMIMRLHIAF